GNQMAFEVIFNRYWKRLYTYAFKIYKEEEICEDIVQEIFINFWKNASTSIILNLEAYLFRAVKYKISNYIRDIKFEQEHLDGLEGIAVPCKTVDDIEYKEFEKNLINKVQKLSPKCREVFILSRFENYSNSEIAKQMELSIHTVEKHISNALKELRSHLNVYQLPMIIIATFL
ncbi:MAG TPA: RNA polymerase sigma-70 factor, partial [Cytophagaceae bacterium]